MKYRPISVRKAVGIYQNRLLDLSQGIIKKSLSCTAVPVDIESKLEQSIVSELQSSAVPEFATLLLCVSGGSDSIALLHLMNAIKRRKMPQLDLKVVNFNHKQRIEADEEAQFVSRVAASYGNDIIIKNLPLHLADKNFSQSLGRKWRRDECQAILASLPNQSGHKYIATAHHIDDQVETLMMKFIRGVHITNLSLMKPLNGAFLKPMLSLRKADILQYLTEHKYEWREDESNQERDYTRNKVRLDLIPIMNELAGGSEVLQRRLLALSEQSKQVSSLLEQQVIEAAKWTRTFYFKNYYVLSFDNLQKRTRYNNPSEIPATVMQQILRSWIVTTIGLQINDYFMLSGVAGLFQADMNDRKSIAITISKKWDIVRIANELRLVPRSKAHPSSNNQTTALRYEGIKVSIQHSSFMHVGIQHQTESRVNDRLTSIPTVGTDMNEENEEIEGENNGKEFMTKLTADVPHQPYSARFSVAMPTAVTVSNLGLNLTIRLIQPEDKALLVAGRRVSKLITDYGFCKANERDRIFVVMHRKPNGTEECLAVLTETTCFPTQEKLMAESHPIFSLQIDILLENVGECS